MTNRQLSLRVGLATVGVLVIVSIAVPIFILSFHSRTTPTAQYETERVVINGQSIIVQIASSPAQQKLGLGGTAALAENAGMIFPYATLSQVTFWMKGMKIPIDIIWIRDGQVIGVTPNIPAPTVPTDTLPLYASPGLIDHVLEVNAGYAARHNIVSGATVSVFSD